jgi:hypothetical protein
MMKKIIIKKAFTDSKSLFFTEDAGLKAKKLKNAQ